MIELKENMIKTMDGIEVPKGHEKIIVDFGKIIAIKSINPITKLPFITWKKKIKSRRFK
jgi:hypothetical protein